jgi:hypothetical protein
MPLYHWGNRELPAFFPHRYGGGVNIVRAVENKLTSRSLTEVADNP